MAQPPAAVALATGIVGGDDQSGLKSVVEYSSCLRWAFDVSRLCGYQRISSRISEEGLEQPLFNRHQGYDLKAASGKTHNQSEVGLRTGQALPELRPPLERHLPLACGFGVSGLMTSRERTNEWLSYDDNSNMPRWDP